MRVARAGFAGLGVKCLTQAMTLARLGFLAWLLLPRDFGLLGIALLVVDALRTLTETGFAPALIHRRDELRPYYDSYFTIHFVRGLLLAGALYGAAPAIAAFFDAPDAVWVVRGIGLLLVLEGMKSPAVAALERDLRFGGIYRVQLAEAVIALAAAVPLGLALRNVWALVGSLLVAQAFTTAASYKLAPYRPRPAFDRARIAELLRFGRQVLGANLLVYVLVNADDILVGRVLGPAVLGLYQVAYRVGSLPGTELAHVVRQVGFPGLAEVQDEPLPLRERTRWLLLGTAMLAFPLAAAIAFLAPDAVRGILGAPWEPAVELIQILCLFGALRAVNGSLGAVAYGIGRPALVTRASLVQLGAFLAMAWPALRADGATGMAWAVTLANGLALLVLGRSLARVLALRGLDLLAPLARSAALAGVVAAVLTGAAALTPGAAGPLARLGIQTAALLLLVGVAAYGGRESLAQWAAVLRSSGER